jgi:hypothetical protein
MTFIKSFRSAPHSAVQSAVAYGLKKAADTVGIADAQSIMQQVTAVLETIPRQLTDPPTPIASTPLGAGSPVSAECIVMLYEYAYYAILGDKSKMQEITNDYEKSNCGQVGWLEAAFEYAFDTWIADEPISYVPPPVPPNDTQFVYALPEQDSFTIGILGDWGTGEPVAQSVINALAAMDVDFIIHVGDVYYAGTQDEVQTNYLGQIANARQSQSHSNVPVYNMPGNHDYYTKGAAFYSALASVNTGTAFRGSSSPAPVQQASFFVLKNSWLQLQAMDTGYNDSDLFKVAHDTTYLQSDELAWHLYQLNAASQAKRTVFLFSHHQPWSRFLAIGTGSDSAAMSKVSYNERLATQLDGVPIGTVAAWFWGHEHVLEVYDQNAIAQSQVNTNGPSLSSVFPWVPYGACIGYSAFPMLESDKPYKVAESSIVDNPAYELGMTTSSDVSVYNHGFTVLQVTKNPSDPNAKPSATATYYWVPGDGSPATPTAFPVSTILPPPAGPSEG